MVKYKLLEFRFICSLNLLSIAAVSHHKMDCFFWTGFYIFINDELLVGPYQGLLDCQKLEKNTGVSWAGINQRKAIIVPDVNKIPGHIACDTRYNFEIVVPIFKRNKVVGVLDVDSTKFNSFDEIDTLWLEKICKLV